MEEIGTLSNANIKRLYDIAHYLYIEELHNVIAQCEECLRTGGDNAPASARVAVQNSIPMLRTKITDYTHEYKIYADKEDELSIKIMRRFIENLLCDNVRNVRYNPLREALKDMCTKAFK